MASESNKWRMRVGASGPQAGRLTIDDLDLRILGVLLRDARTSFRSISAKLHVSVSTVAARAARLEKAGVVRGYSAVLDYSLLGFELTAVTSILVSKGRLLEVQKEVARLPGVCAVYDVTGEFDSIVIAKFRDREELSRFAKNVLAMPFVERTNTHLVLTTMREDFRLPVRQ